AALLERQRGADVFAVTLELWSDPGNDGERSCCSADAVRVARSVAQQQGIPHLTVDLRDSFRSGVVEPFLAGYAAGETPNPCVRCNGRVRIAPMIAIAERLGAGALATGHYARVDDDGAGPLLTAAADEAKDQAYMLAGLPTAALAKLRFPLGGLSKPEVREIAAGAGLPVAGRPESQDLCFLAGVGKTGFLAAHGGLADREGEIVDRAGTVLGAHRGHHRFTVGQRRGLGIASPEPLYVLATDAGSNRVVVGPADGLDTRRVRIRDAILHRPASRVGAVKVRYRARPLACRVNGGGELRGAGRCDELELELSAPVRAAAPGQTAVLFDGDLVVGHGTIA
ncbi:MAG: tRNA 2-thiouridine(34) synthase MnmA, partial [Solirubrobacterales bacterium]|nr:tRNA 2-thiouridine(34) synthase MnmA [Solirubrobacterales bacterium]